MRWLHRTLLVLALLAVGCGNGVSPVGLENESEILVDKPDIPRPLVPGDTS